MGLEWDVYHLPTEVNRWFIELFLGFQRINHPTLVVQDFATIHSMGEKHMNMKGSQLWMEKMKVSLSERKATMCFTSGWGKRHVRIMCAWGKPEIANNDSNNKHVILLNMNSYLAGAPSPSDCWFTIPIEDLSKGSEAAILMWKIMNWDQTEILWIDNDWVLNYCILVSSSHHWCLSCLSMLG